MAHLPAAPRKPFNSKGRGGPHCWLSPHASCSQRSQSPLWGKAGVDGLQEAVGTCTTPGTCTFWAQLSVKLALRFSTNAVMPSLRSFWDKQRGEVSGGCSSLVTPHAMGLIPVLTVAKVA